MKKICFVLTTDLTVKSFLLGHLFALSNAYDVTLVTNTNNPSFLKELGLNVKVVPLSIARSISLYSDLTSLIALIKLFHKEAFSSVHSVTPKAGLLAMLAAWIVSVPLRVHTFTGQVWVTKTGITRFLLKKFDCLIALLTTQNIVDSPSQLKFLIDEKVMPLAKSNVFSKGSISGVDVGRFRPDDDARKKIRAQFNVYSNAVVFLFVGRLTLDKGVLDLAEAFSQLGEGHAYLFFVGPDESGMQAEIKRITQNRGSYVHFLGHTNTPECFMAAADVLCLPSYREGFGSVVIEAAAVGIPTIASRIYGITDAVVEGETGLLHAAHDIDAIRICMMRLIADTELRLQLGVDARTRAVKDFDADTLTREWVRFYRENIN